WKTSYRLSLDKDAKNNKAFLQGWAIVENTTDEDWQNVRLGLVSGRPISFRMDLYEPLYVQRPVVEPELFASLRPPTYSGDMTQGKDGSGKRAGLAPPLLEMQNKSLPAFGGAGLGGGGGIGGGLGFGGGGPLGRLPANNPAGAGPGPDEEEERTS